MNTEHWTLNSIHIWQQHANEHSDRRICRINRKINVHNGIQCSKIASKSVQAIYICVAWNRLRCLNQLIKGTWKRKGACHNIIFLSSRHANTTTQRHNDKRLKRRECRKKKAFMQRQECERHHLSIIDWLNGIPSHSITLVVWIFFMVFCCLTSQILSHSFRFVFFILVFFFLSFLPRTCLNPC